MKMTLLTAPIDFVAVEFSKDDIRLIRAALDYATDQSHVHMQMPLPDAASVGLALSDWASDWRRNISEAVGFVMTEEEAFADPVRYAYRFFIVADEKPAQMRYVLFGDMRITSRLQTVLHWGQTWAESEQCTTTIALRRATGAHPMVGCAYDAAAIDVEQRAIYDRFSAMREAI